MAENSDSKNSLDVELPEEPDSSDLENDWETAFKAEDFFVDDGDEASDFFLADDNSGEDFDLAALLDQESAGISKDSAPAPDKEIQHEQPDETVADEDSGKVSGLPIFPAVLWQRYKNFKIYQKIAVPALAACLVWAAIFVFSGKTPEQKTADSVPPPPPPVVAEKITEDRPHSTLPPVKPEHSSLKVVDQAVESSKKTSTTALLRKKWPFSSFLIASEQKGDKKIIFVAIDLTLITLLPQGASPPEEKEAFVRDLIYQFFVNQPAYELKRYSLARGEMIRRLRSWILRQWPDSPIETITFSRYQVLK